MPAEQSKRNAIDRHPVILYFLEGILKIKSLGSWSAVMEPFIFHLPVFVVWQPVKGAISRIKIQKKKDYPIEGKIRGWKVWLVINITIPNRSERIPYRFHLKQVISAKRME